MSVVAWEPSYITSDRIIFCNEQTESLRSHSQTAQISEEYIPVGCLYPLPYTSVVGKKKLSNAKSENIFICIILLIIPSASLVFSFWCFLLFDIM